jgi:hypothetical protein
VNHAGAAKCGGCEGEAASDAEGDPVGIAWLESEYNEWNNPDEIMSAVMVAVSRERAKSKALLDALKTLAHHVPDIAHGRTLPMSQINAYDNAMLAIEAYEGEA